MHPPPHRIPGPDGRGGGGGVPFGEPFSDSGTWSCGCHTKKTGTERARDTQGASNTTHTRFWPVPRGPLGAPRLSPPPPLSSPRRPLSTLILLPFSSNLQRHMNQQQPILNHVCPIPHLPTSRWGNHCPCVLGLLHWLKPTQACFAGGRERERERERERRALHHWSTMSTHLAPTLCSDGQSTGSSDPREQLPPAGLPSILNKQKFPLSPCLGPVTPPPSAGCPLARPPQKQEQRARR